MLITHTAVDQDEAPLKGNVKEKERNITWCMPLKATTSAIIWNLCSLIPVRFWKEDVREDEEYATLLVVAAFDKLEDFDYFACCVDKVQIVDIQPCPDRVLLHFRKG